MPGPAGSPAGGHQDQTGRVAGETTRSRRQQPPERRSTPGGAGGRRHGWHVRPGGDARRDSCAPSRRQVPASTHRPRRHHEPFRLRGGHARHGRRPLPIAPPLARGAARRGGPRRRDPPHRGARGGARRRGVLRVRGGHWEHERRHHRQRPDRGAAGHHVDEQWPLRERAAVQRNDLARPGRRQRRAGSVRGDDARGLGPARHDLRHGDRARQAAQPWRLRLRPRARGREAGRARLRRVLDAPRSRRRRRAIRRVAVPRRDLRRQLAADVPRRRAGRRGAGERHAAAVVQPARDRWQLRVGTRGSAARSTTCASIRAR